MKTLQAALAAVALTLFATAAQARGFDYDAFQPTRLADAKANFLAEASQPVPGTGGKLLTNSLNLGSQRWRARAAYAGRSRPLQAEELAFIRLWLKSAGHEDFAEQFVASYLFTADGVEYWLPVEAPVAEFFPKELKPGDKLDLYLAEIGGTRRGDVWLWLPLVEEFRKIEDSR